MPFLGGLDIRRQRLDTRRRLLREIVADLPDPTHFSETFDVPAKDLKDLIRVKALRGLVAKRRDSTYRPGRRDGDG